MKKQLIDQTAHFVLAFLICAPLLMMVKENNAMTVLAATLTGFLAGMVREVTAKGDPVTVAKVLRVLKDGNWMGARLDLAFWALGGAVAGALI